MIDLQEETSTVQTKDQVIGKIANMMVGRLYGDIIAEATRLLEAGVLSLDEADNDFRVPKLIYVQALRNIAERYAPMHYDREGVKELRDLARHCFSPGH